MTSYFFRKTVEIKAENMGEAEAKFRSMLHEKHGWVMSPVPITGISLEAFFEHMTIEDIKAVYEEWQENKKSEEMKEELEREMADY